MNVKMQHCYGNVLEFFMLTAERFPSKLLELNMATDTEVWVSIPGATRFSE